MRDLTENEKKTIRNLIEKYHPSGINRIGEALLGVHQIKGMKRVELEKGEEEYQKVHKTDVRRIEISYYGHENRNFTSEFYESILLLEFLIENRYITYNKVIDMEEIGDNTVSLAQLIDNIKVDGHLTSSKFFNASQTDLWNLLSSTYIITNNLRDYAEHDFKTPEQRRFDIQMTDAQNKFETQMKSARKATFISWAAFVVAFISTLFQIFTTITSKNTMKIDEPQIESIINSIREDKTNMYPPIEISFKDTVKVRNVDN